MSFDAAEFRKVLGHFATGVTVVTTTHGGEPHAMTVNSFASVSLDPPLVLFCADKRTRTHAAVQASGVFAVNMLRDGDRPISDLFAGKGTDAERLAVLSSGAGETGSPVLPGALGWLDCRVAAAHDAGDHVIYVGSVIGAARGEAGSPLLYFRGTYQALDEAWRWPDRYAAKERSIRFDDMVDFFDRMESEGPYAALLADLVALGDPGPDARCLDLGCGAGRLARDLAARSREAIGVDVSARMLERAVHRAKAAGAERVAYQEARAEALPFPDASFDLVTASNLLMTLADPAAVLKEAARVIRPGGRIAILEPLPAMSQARMAAFLDQHGHRQFAARAMLAWANAAEANRPFDEDRLLAELRAAGLETISQTSRLDGLALLSLARKS